MATPAEMLSGARSYLLMKSPFFGTISMFMRMKEDMNIDTLATDGVNFFYNPDFVKSLSATTLRTGFVHELFHIILKHHLRKGAREHKKWNIACDFAVNLMLRKSGFAPIEGWLYDEKYEGMNAETIYHSLTDDDVKQLGGRMFGEVFPMPGGEGNGKGNTEAGQGPIASQAEMAKAEMEWNSTITMAANAAKKAGKLPAGLEAMLEEMTESKTDWEALLARFVDAYAKNDYSFKRPSRSAMQRGFWAPGLSSEELGDCLIVMDLSGSIGRKEKAEQLGEVFAIIDRYDVNLTIASADTQIYMVGQWSKGDLPVPSEMEFKGGGGTSLDQLLPWLAENHINPRFAIYLTDGYLTDWGEEPAFPLLVATLPGGTTHYTPNWAEIVHIT